MTPELLIQRSAVAAVVSDPRQPDNPIVACNDAFVQLTGYPRAEILGRNCRFLRGPGTDPEATAMLRDAIATARPTIVELTNYRKDGTSFRNAIMIAPLFDDDGKLVYFLGSQMAVNEPRETARGKSQALVARLSRRQRQVLAGLASGRLNKQIAHELGLTERTVKMHRAAMLQALDVRSLAEAMRIAIDAGL